MITRIVVLEDSSGAHPAPRIAGTGRRFVSTVSTGSVRRTREVELAKTVAAVRPDDQLMSIPQHTLLYRARRGIAIALAVADAFAEGSDLESLQARNTRAPLEGDEAVDLQEASVSLGLRLGLHPRVLSAAADRQPMARRPTISTEPDFLFDTPQDALKSLIAGLDRALAGSKDDADLTARARAFARVAIDGLLSAQGPLRRARRVRERAYPHRCRRFHPRRLRRRAGQEVASRW